MTEIDNQEAGSTEGTEIVQNSLRDELKANFEKQIENSDNESETEGTKDTEKPEIVAETNETEDNTIDEKEIETPSGWNKAEREQFETLDPAAKEILTKYDKSRQADYTRKTQEVAEQRKEVEGLVSITEPYKDDFKRLGVKPADYFSQLMQVDISLSKDPAGTMQKLIAKFNLKADDLGFTAQSESTNHEADDDYLTDTEVKLKKENKDLKLKLDALDKQVTGIVETNSSKEEQTAVQKVLKEFTDAEDDDGNIAHPHFDNEDVKNEMSILVNTGKTLDEAYNSSPTVKMLELDNKNKETPVQRSTRKKQEIAKAKTASKRVKSSSAGEIDYSTMSLRGELESKLKASGSRF